ncbi:MAG: helix-turn-helix domain-containing protein [Ignavibacteriaceae bacterium]|nr:helix-turn-helix domain-containing protein [Ignavibacteriaceae bacterium]
MQKLLSAQQVAKKLRKSKQQVNNDIQAGKLKAQKVGNFWVIAQTDLDKFIQAKRKR